jgi:hypothetical protein
VERKMSKELVVVESNEVKSAELGVEVQTKDVTVLSSGEAYISQRKAAELCGLNVTLLSIS